MSFDQPKYIVNEGEGILPFMLVLSNPASFDIEVYIRDKNMTATSM